VIRPLHLAPLIVLGLAAALPARASASLGLDPFRRVGAKATSPLDPFRVSDAAAPPASSSASSPAASSSAASPAASSAGSSPAASSSAASPAASAPKACTSDDQCPDETICEESACRPVPKSANILYLYYRDGAFTEIFGLYWSRRGSSGYTVVAPLWWHTFSPQSQARVLAPFLWSFESYATRSLVTVLVPLAVHTRDAEGAFTYVVPFNFFWRDKEREHALVIPLFYSESHRNGGSAVSWLGYKFRDGPRTSGSILWLYWYGEDRSVRSKYHLLFPLLWDFAEKDDRATVVFPLVWRFASGDASTTVAGPWVHLRGQTSTFDAVLPLWWSGRDDKAGSAFKLLVPFFYWQSRANGRRVAWVSPIGGYSRDDDEGSKTLAIVPLLSFWRHDPDRTIRVFTPLYVHSRSERADTTTNWLGLLLYYGREDPGGSTTAVTPLFWRFHDAQTGATATALLPFVGRRVGPRDTTTFVGVFPVGAYWRSFAGGGWSGGLFPLAFFGANAGRSHAVVFPFLWHTAGPDDATTVAAPFFYRHRDPRGHAGGIPLALTFWGARDGDSYAVQFPLVWHFASERARSSTTVTPLGYLHRDADGWSLGAGPLLPILWVRSGQTRSHAVLFPLFWHFRDGERSTTVVGPYWHRSWGGETTDALFPFLHFRRGARPGGTDETSFTLLPFVHYHRDATTRVLVTPLGASARGREREAGFLGPYFWYKDRQLDASFIPFLHADVTRRDTGERARQFGPFFMLDGPGKKARVLFPLAGRYEDAHESDTYVFPSFFRLRRDDGTRVDTLLPFFWRSAGGGRATTIVGLWFDHTAPGVRNVGLLPFWFRARNAERSLTVIPPLLFVHQHDFQDDSERLWCALLWRSRDGASSRTVAFPLWWARQSEAGGYKVLFPIFWRWSDTKADKTSTLVGPLYWSSWGTGRSYGLLPFAWFSRNRADGSGSAGVMPLFYEAHGPGRRTFATLLFGVDRRPASRLTYFGPIVPFYLSLENLPTETSTTVIPPLLVYHRTSPESSFTTALGLFWHARDITSTTTLALPLYYDFHDLHLARTTLVLPFFLRHENEAAHSVAWLAPLFYRRTAPNESSTVLFPLFWDFKSGDDHTTVLAPFFARWHRADHDSTWVFPTIYHRTGLGPGGAPDGTWHTVVAPFYAAAVKRPGDFMWEVLGGLLGHESVGRNRYLKLFFLRFEQEPAPRAQTAWYGQPARPSRRQPVRGLSMNTW
jgi:hypothetical protein